MILFCDTSALIKLLIDEPGSDQIKQIQTWEAFTIVEVSQELVKAAGLFADGFALRGYDSVQLAAAHQLHTTTNLSLTFASYDRRLNQAAQLLQLEVLG